MERISMNRQAKLEAPWQFVKVMAEYPQMAKIILAQQMVLQEVAQTGVRLVEDRMCGLMEVGVPVLFLDYWRGRCNRKPPELSPILECIATARNPQDCFRLGNDEWFGDPLADGQKDPSKAIPM